MSVVSGPRGPLRQYLSLLLSLDSAKSGLFYYVVFTQAIKAHRHLRARGITATVKELYTWISQVAHNASKFCSIFISFY